MMAHIDRTSAGELRRRAETRGSPCSFDWGRDRSRMRELGPAALCLLCPKDVPRGVPLVVDHDSCMRM